MSSALKMPETIDQTVEIWPKALMGSISTKMFSAKVTEVEAFFEKKYPSCKAVLFSSGRAGLFSILKMCKMSRQDHIWVPPFSSHCVLNTISFLATPSVKSIEENENLLLFHQWGFEFQLPKEFQKKLIIEDSVDSLIVDEAALFPNNGRFELFSLPKILGCAYGGVVLCHSADDADALKQTRDSNMNLGLRHQLRRLQARTNPKMNYLWSNTEPLNGKIYAFMLDSVLKKLNEWESIEKDRLEKVELLKEFSAKEVWPNSKRLPVCIPIATSESHKKTLESLNLFVGSRSLVEASNTQEVYPVPIHQEVDLKRIESLAQHLRSERETEND